MWHDWNRPIQVLVDEEIAMTDDLRNFVKAAIRVASLTPEPYTVETSRPNDGTVYKCVVNMDKYQAVLLTQDVHNAILATEGTGQITRKNLWHDGDCSFSDN
jgi:hypothetical protein